jgi:cell division protein ZipA
LAAELRWILLGLSLPLLAFIWWWTARRAGQSPGDPALREPSAGKPAAGKPAAGKPAEPAPPLDPRYIDHDDEEMKPEPASREWGVPPFEPLNIRTADFDRVPVLDGPMMVNPHPQPAAAAIPAQVPIMRAVAPPIANAAELQRIVTIRVCAPGEARWSGAQLTAALELHGLAFGRYHVFHRNHVDGRSLFCVASLIEPGTFDLAGMADQEFRGITLFAVLPGPIAPLETMDELFATARGLAEELSGMVQDAKGIPLSPQRAAALREDVARFQALLPRN